MPEDSNAPVTTSRRAVVRTGLTAAWAAPVIVAATSVPAYAASPTEGVLTLDRGASGFVDDQYYSFQFQGLTVSSSQGVEPGLLQLVVSSNKGLYRSASVPSGWMTSDPAEVSLSSVTYVFSGALAPGATLPVPDGIYFDIDGQTSTTVTLRFSAPEHADAAISLTGPAAPPTGSRPSGNRTAR